MSETLSDSEKKQRANLIPFKKGDPRINRKGRPKSFDQLRALAIEVAHRLRIDKRENIIAILEDWATSNDPTKQRMFVEYCYGKVPDKLETTTETPAIIFRHANSRNGRDVATATRGTATNN